MQGEEVKVFLRHLLPACIHQYEIPPFLPGALHYLYGVLLSVEVLKTLGFIKLSLHKKSNKRYCGYCHANIVQRRKIIYLACDFDRFADKPKSHSGSVNNKTVTIT